MTVRRTQVPEEIYPLGALRLYREDLNAIATAVAEAGTLRISGEGMDADSPGDLDQFPGKLTTLTIEAVKDTLSPVIVELTKLSATVKLTDPTTQTRGILMGIRQLCEPRRLRLRSWVSNFQGTLPLVILVGAIEIAFVAATALEGLGDPKKATGWIVSPAWLACLSAAVLVTAVYIALGLVPRVTLINMPKSESPTYWQRTRDSWIVGTITGLIGTAVGIGIGYVLPK